jgi:hypothetical protein
VRAAASRFEVFKIGMRIVFSGVSFDGRVARGIFGQPGPAWSADILLACIEVHYLTRMH